MVEERGVFVTTASNLGSAPVVSFRTAGGSTGDAWVIGRDDSLDMALLEVISPGQIFTVMNLHTGNIPLRDEALVLLQFPATSAQLDKKNSAVVGSRQDLTGIDYVQIQALAAPGGQGGAVIDNTGTLRGLRMADQHVIDIGIARAGETWAIDARTLGSLVLPQLQTGVISIDTSGVSCEVGTIPNFAVFRGEATVGGAPIAVGSRMYMRVTSAAGELWFTDLTTREGRYTVDANICGTAFENGVIDFWFAASRASQTSVLVAGRTTDISLTFP